MINLSWQEKVGPDEFAADVNSYLPKAFYIKDITQPENKLYYKKHGTYQIICDTDGYFDVAYFNPTDKFGELINTLGMKHFGVTPDYNNTGEIFWFYGDINE